MKNSLPAETKVIIQDSFRDNPVYLFIRPTALEYQQLLQKVKLAPEEIFFECFRLLDKIKTCPDSASEICSVIFDDSYSNLLNIFPGSPENEIRNGASLISLSVAMCLNAIDREELFVETTGPVIAKDTLWDGISRSYSARISKYAQPLLDFLTDYMSSERKISEEISRLPSARQIDTAQLQYYFKPAFRGIGRGEPIDFYSKLIEMLKVQRNAKDFAIIAKMIYDSPHHTNKLSTFTKWHQTFCTIVGCKYVPYKPNQLSPTSALKSEFSSLY